MSIELILTTLIASSVDSLNPVTTTQQFVLQGMLEKRYHIWFFIIATFITNFTFGLLVYYGLITFISNFWDKIYSVAGKSIHFAEMILGFVFLIFAVKAIKKVLKGSSESAGNQETEIKNKIKSVKPISLFTIGVVSTAMELTSALPYFTFVGILVNYKLNIGELLIIQLLYNLIYSLPLFFMYFIYCKKQSLFDRLYAYLKNKISAFSSWLAPILTCLIAVLLLGHSFYSML